MSESSAPRVYDERLLGRYRKVFALLQQGVGGEKDTAQRLVAKMQTDYPDIHEQAFPKPPPQVSDSLRANPLWEFLNSFAGQVREGSRWVARAAYEAAQIEAAYAYADELFEVWTETRKHTWRLVVRADDDDLSAVAAEMSAVQREVLADALAARFRQHLIEELEILSDDPGESDEWAV